MTNPSCGTNSGYQIHFKNKEKFCIPCKEAHSLYRRTQYLKNKTREQELHNLWKMSNFKKMNSYRNKWRENNRDKARESDKNWRLNNPEYGVLKEGRRRAQKNSTTVEHFTEQQVLDLYGTVCYLCNEEIDMNAPRRTNRQGWEKGLHLDHVLPLALGGGHTLDNLRPTHGICNTRKQGKIVELATAVPDTYDQS